MVVIPFIDVVMDVVAELELPLGGDLDERQPGFQAVGGSLRACW